MEDRYAYSPGNAPAKAENMDYNDSYGENHTHSMN